MNKAELVEAIAKATGYQKTAVNEILSEFVGLTGKTVKKGDTVQLVGLGTFKRVARKARVGVNPATGAKLKIPARKTIKFTASANLKKL
ncbi:HU family DNA-binding protein [Candidatus Woesearchaeota archaeon]|nr:HU family DNA-binding protein [Candidatus Woesearchaeota archaeon]